MVDDWFDHAMDTQQVITSFNLQTDYDAVIGVGHSFGASAMYNNLSPRSR